MKSEQRKSAFIFLLFVLAVPVLAFALPEGENVVAGSASFDRSQANTLNVVTPSDKLIVNYNSFNIARAEFVNFNQPSSQSVVLNRVVGIDPSSIMGSLSANGRIFIVNPNGVFFGPDSRVDVAGLVASSLNIENEDFLNGNYMFSQSGKAGYVINQGKIVAQEKGFVCLLGGAVDNQAFIQADLGTIVLASGAKMTLALENDSSISLVVDEAIKEGVFGPDGLEMKSAVKNSGSILAEGGKVILNAKLLNKVFDQAINNTGLVKVTSLVKHDGIVELTAEGAPIVNSGTIEADKVTVLADASFINSGLIKAPEVYIKVSNADIINTASGKIIADLSSAVLNGSKIFLEAASILQQGFISANVEQGTAGEISMISVNNTVLDENSSTEARAVGISGNGGQITIDSKQGSVFVNKNAKIDFSAGSVSGNGGLLKVDAFQQLGFYGILNGRAPPGYTLGKALLDPESSTVSGEFTGDITFFSPGDISIVGNIFLGYNTTLNIFADHNSEEAGDWHDGIGQILNAGEFMITGYEGSGGTLNLMAGSGIGSIDGMIWTNVRYLSAVINPNSPEGDIMIDQDTSTLYITDIRSPGLVVLMALGRVLGASEGPAITADELYIDAYGGIGYFDEGIDPLYVSVNNLAVWNEGSGHIVIHNYKDLTLLAAVNEAPAGAINIEVDGALKVRYGIITEDYISLYATGDITLSTRADITAWGQGSSIDLTAENGQIARMPEEGLLAYWNFDEGSNYYVYDQVTGAYSYVNGSPTVAENEVNGSLCLQFDGVDDYINTYRNFGFGSGEFTLMCWYKGTQSLNNVGLMGASPRNEGYALETQFGYLQSWINNDMDAGSTFISDNQWHQLAMVREGSEGSLYVDGMPDLMDFSTSGGSVDTASSFWIGGWGHMKRLAQGSIDDVRVYGRALSGLEIHSLDMIAPGTGRISASRVELYAENGVDVGFGTVNNFQVSNNTGNIFIDSLSDLTVDSGTFENYDGMGITDGDITLITAGNMYVNSDIYTIGDHDLTLTADGNIVLAQQVSVYSNSDVGEGDLPTGYSGNVSLSAGQDVIFNYGASVYSYAGAYAYEGSSAFAQSGDVTIIAGRDIDMEFGRINSQANANGYGSCIAYSGDVILSAGHNIYESGWLELIYSQAYASVYENPDTTALAQSGLVSIYAGNSLSIDGRDAEYTYGADVFSYAYAYGGLTAEAYSSGVSISTGSGDISIFRTDVRSDASAQTFASGDAATYSEAIAGSSYYDYNNYEYSYLAVLVDAGGNIAAYDNTMIYGRAVASGSAFDSYARAGDVTLDALYAINLGSHIYSDSIANAGDVARAVSGKVNLISYYGPITVPETALVWSNASANTIYEYSEAFAESDDVTVQCWYGPVTINQGVSSTAEAYANEAISPARLQATSGNVSVGSGYSYAEYWTSIYGPYYYYYVGYFAPDEYYYANDLTVNSYIFSSTSTSSDNAQELRLTSGDVTLFGANISLTNGRVYSGINDDEDIPTAVNTAYVTSGDIGFFASGDISVSGYAEITSSALAHCSSIEASGTSVLAIPGGITLKADGDITLDLANLYTGHYPIDTYGYASFYESVPVLTGGTISLLADADWSGSGVLSSPSAAQLDLRATNFDFSGANEFVFDTRDEEGAYGLFVNSEDVEVMNLNLRLILPSEATVPGISLASTLENTLTVNNLVIPDYGLLEFAYLRFYSAGDLLIRSYLTADTIELIADYDKDGLGDLFSYTLTMSDLYGQFYVPGQITLTAGSNSHILQSAGDISIIGDRVFRPTGEVYDFDVVLSTSDEGLGDLSITSTNGSIIVTDYEGEQTPLEREGAAGIDLWAADNIVINTPIIVENGGLSLISEYGSIVAGIPQEGSITHITAASDVYMRAGNEDMEESNSMIGTIDAPLNILVTAGAVELEVYGQQTFLIDEVETAVSGNLIGTVNGSSEANAILVLNNAPGVVFFNNGPAPEYTEPPEPPDPYEPPPSPHEEEPESLPLPPAQTPYVISYENNPVDPVELNAFQQNSMIGGQFYLYHPVSETDMGAFDQLMIGADSYQLRGGQLQLIGHDSLQQFFQEFDKKRRQL